MTYVTEQRRLGDRRDLFRRADLVPGCKRYGRGRRDTVARSDGRRPRGIRREGGCLAGAARQTVCVLDGWPGGCQSPAQRAGTSPSQHSGPNLGTTRVARPPSGLWLVPGRRPDTSRWPPGWRKHCCPRGGNRSRLRRMDRTTLYRTARRWARRRTTARRRGRLLETRSALRDRGSQDARQRAGAASGRRRVRNSVRRKLLRRTPGGFPSGVRTIPHKRDDNLPGPRSSTSRCDTRGSGTGSPTGCWSRACSRRRNRSSAPHAAKRSRAA
jgi:hypothetical protein